jgi:hypothetical protein
MTMGVPVGSGAAVDVGKGVGVLVAGIGLGVAVAGTGVGNCATTSSVLVGVGVSTRVQPLIKKMSNSHNKPEAIRTACVITTQSLALRIRRTVMTARRVFILPYPPFSIAGNASR